MAVLFAVRNRFPCLVGLSFVALRKAWAIRKSAMAGFQVGRSDFCCTSQKSSIGYSRVFKLATRSKVARVGFPVVVSKVLLGHFGYSRGWSSSWWLFVNGC